jgi:7-cyano-7-deazaguanine reductase
VDNPTVGLTDELATIPAREGLGLVVLTSDELTAICPLVMQPDYYTLRIEYVPDRLCIETRSLKRYLQSFRDQEAFCENLAVSLRDTVVQAIHPRYCKVTLTQGIRGGITIKAISTFGRQEH